MAFHCTVYGTYAAFSIPVLENSVAGNQLDVYMHGRFVQAIEELTAKTDPRAQWVAFSGVSLIKYVGIDIQKWCKHAIYVGLEEESNEQIWFCTVSYIQHPNSTRFTKLSEFTPGKKAQVFAVVKNVAKRPTQNKKNNGYHMMLDMVDSTYQEGTKDGQLRLNIFFNNETNPEIFEGLNCGDIIRLRDMTVSL